MKNMPNLKLLILFLITFVLVSSCAGSPSSKCKANADCASGYLCNSSSVCLLGDPMTITTTEITPAIINSAYSFQINHTGGLDPLTWSIDTSSAGDSLDWLTIDSATGMLANIQLPQEKIPSKTTSAVNVTVTVKDSSDNGTGTMVSRTYSMIIRECNNGTVAFRLDGSKTMCMEGTQQCNNGVLGVFEETAVSTNPSHCGVSGDQCGYCNLLFADTCNSGQICLCGNEDACSVPNSYCCNEKCTAASDTNNCGGCGIVCDPGETCCSGKCADLSTDANNCVTCGYKCDGQHATGAICDAGCVYTSATCETGWGNCGTGDWLDGCETDLTKPETCSGCDASNNCSSSSDGPACVLINGNYKCGCSNSDQCKVVSQHQSWGCCDGTCIDLSKTNNCGWCGIQCHTGENCFSTGISFCYCDAHICPSPYRCLDTGTGSTMCYCYESGKNKLPCSLGEICCKNGDEYKCCPEGDCSPTGCP